MKRMFFCMLYFACILELHVENFVVKSPNGQLVCELQIGEKIYWKATYKGKEVISNTAISMEFSSGVKFGINPKVVSKKVNTINTFIIPGVSHKDAKIKDEYSELVIDFKGNYSLKCRAYDDGIGYQFIDKNSAPREVVYEQMALSFPESTKSLFPMENSMYSHNERMYLNKSINEIEAKQF